MNIPETYPWFIPGVVASTILAAVLARPVGRALRVSPLFGFLLAASAGVVVSATLLPGTPGSTGSGACDLSRLALPSPTQLFRPGEILLNVLLFVPLGGIIAVLPASPFRSTVIVGAFASPFLIEGIQLVAVPLGRACESGDLIDNLTGLTVGTLAGLSIRGLSLLRRHDSGDANGSDADAPGGRLVMVAVALALGILLLAAAALPAQPVPAPSGGVRPTLPPGASAAPPGSPSPSDGAAPTDGAAPASVRVTSVRELLRSLADDRITEIVVADGRYEVSSAGRHAADSLWIGARFADRTRPVTVRAETRGGVTFDGRGANLAWLWFTEGAHHQTWDGFVFANGSPASTGVLFFGEGDGEAPHDLTFRNITIDRSVTGSAVTESSPATDHAIYVSDAIGGPRNLVFEDIMVDGRGGLASAFHFYHSRAPRVNASDVTVRRLEVIGTQQAIILWDPTLRGITFEDVRITDPLKSGVTYESPGATDIVLSNVTSTGSGNRGLLSSLGPNPPGLTLVGTSLR